MAYVITGATGHIGNNLVRQLVKRKEYVVVLVRKIDVSIKNLPIKYCIGNLFDIDFLCANIHEGDYVIHLAAVIDIKDKKAQETKRVNYELTKLITDICIKRKVKQLVYCSSVDAIYKEKAEELIKEPVLIDPSKFDSNYGKTKAMATVYVMEQRIKHPEIKIAIVYPSAVIGINDWKPSFVGKVIKDILKGKVEFGINGGYDFVDVEDVVWAMIKIMDLTLNEDFILAGHACSVTELYKHVNDIIDIKHHVYKVPMIIVYLAIPFVPYLSKNTLRILIDNYNYDYTKAEKMLDYKPKSLDETFKNTVKWFIEQDNKHNK